MRGIPINRLIPRPPHVPPAQISQLPSRAPSASDAEHDDYWIDSKDGSHIDGYTHPKLPWMLVATVDAYPSGSILQRARALQWLESAVQQQSVVAADTHPTNWWAC